jgi:hypothetical protein
MFLEAQVLGKWWTVLEFTLGWSGGLAAGDSVTEGGSYSSRATYCLGLVRRFRGKFSPSFTNRYILLA